MRVGDLANAPFGQSVALKPSTSTLVARAVASSFAPSTATVSVAPPKLVSAPVLLAVQADGPCGAEPARKSANASGAAQYADAAAGAAYLACQERLNAAATAAAYAAIDGAPNCGPEPPFTISSSTGAKVYRSPNERVNAADLGRYWQACRARMAAAPVAPPPPASPSSVSRPVPLQAPPSSSSSSSSGGGAALSFEPSDASSSSPSLLEKAATPDLQKTPVSATVDIPTEMWIGLGILGAATILGVVYLATRHQAPRKAA